MGPADPGEDAITSTVEDYFPIKIYLLIFYFKILYFGEFFRKRKIQFKK